MSSAEQVTPTIAPPPSLRLSGRLGAGSIVFMVIAAAAPLTIIGGVTPIGCLLGDLAAERATSGALLLHGATAWMECVPVAEHDAGNHVIVLLEVRATRTEPASEPLILHRGRAFAPVPAVMAG